MCMCVSAFVCVCACVWVHVCVIICVCRCVCSCASVRACVCACVCACVRVYPCDQMLKSSRNCLRYYLSGSLLRYILNCIHPLPAPLSKVQLFDMQIMFFWGWLNWAAGFQRPLISREDGTATRVHWRRAGDFLRHEFNVTWQACYAKNALKCICIYMKLPSWTRCSVVSSCVILHLDLSSILFVVFFRFWVRCITSSNVIICCSLVASFRAVVPTPWVFRYPKK